MRTKDENKRQQIEQAVMKLVNTIGYSNISMSKIAKEAKISPSMLYVYYENQEDMFRSIFMDKKKEMYLSLGDHIDSAMDTKDMVYQFCRNILSFGQNHMDEFLFIQQSMDSPYVNGAAQEAADEFGENIIETFNAGISKGDLKNKNGIMLISFCVYPIAMIYKEALKTDGMLQHINFNDVFELCWDAVKK